MSTIEIGVRYHWPGSALGIPALDEGRLIVTLALALMVIRLVPREIAYVPIAVIGNTASCGIVCQPSEGPNQTFWYWRKVPPWSRSSWEPMARSFALGGRLSLGFWS